MTYDKDGDLLTQTGAGGTATTLARVFTYNGDDQMTQAQTCTDPTCVTGTVDSSENYTYDSEGDLTSATSDMGSAGNSSFTYNDDGLMASRTDASGTSTYTYDSDDRLVGDQDAASGQHLTYSYNNMDQVTQIAYSGGDTREFEYNAVGELTSDEVENPSGGPVGEIDYGYDAAGELTSMNDYGIGTSSADSDTANSYTYNEAGELASWTATPPDGSASTVNYGYDDAGNRTSVNGTTYTYDQRDELTSNGTNTYTYAADGTLASSTVTATGLEGTDTFDAYGQQATAGWSTYTYDALGRLLTSGTTTLSYSGQGNDVASDGTTTYSRDPDGTITGLQSSALGQQAAWTDQHTNLVATFGSGASGLSTWTVYDPLGNVINSNGAQPSLGYQSEYTDPASGQVNMDARWYSPSEGQFTSADTMNNSPVPNTANANPYSYADDSPLTGADPTGHYACPSNICGDGSDLASDSLGEEEMDEAKAADGERAAEEYQEEQEYKAEEAEDEIMEEGDRELDDAKDEGNERAAEDYQETHSSGEPGTSTDGSSSDGSSSDDNSGPSPSRAPAKPVNPISTEVGDAKASAMGRVSSGATLGVSQRAGTDPQTTIDKVKPPVAGSPLYTNGLLITQSQVQDVQAGGSTLPQEADQSSCTANGSSMIYYMPLDSDGRAEGAVACLNYSGFNYIASDGSGKLYKDVPPTNLIGSAPPWPPSQPGFFGNLPVGWWFQSGLQRGHLIARQLGGDGDDVRNLVSLYKYTNTQLMDPEEDKIADAIDEGQTVYMSVIPNYSGNSPIPTSISMTAVTSNGAPIVVGPPIPNVPGEDQ